MMQSFNWPWSSKTAQINWEDVIFFFLNPAEMQYTFIKPKRNICSKKWLQGNHAITKYFPQKTHTLLWDFKTSHFVHTDCFILVQTLGFLMPRAFLQNKIQVGISRDGFLLSHDHLPSQPLKKPTLCHFHYRKATIGYEDCIFTLEID